MACTYLDKTLHEVIRNVGMRDVEAAPPDTIRRLTEAELQNAVVGDTVGATAHIDVDDPPFEAQFECSVGDGHVAGRF